MKRHFATSDEVLGALTALERYLLQYGHLLTEADHGWLRYAKAGIERQAAAALLHEKRS